MSQFIFALRGFNYCWKNRSLTLHTTGGDTRHTTDSHNDQLSVMSAWVIHGTILTLTVQHYLPSMVWLIRGNLILSRSACVFVTLSNLTQPTTNMSVKEILYIHLTLQSQHTYSLCPHILLLQHVIHLWKDLWLQKVVSVATCNDM